MNRTMNRPRPITAPHHASLRAATALAGCLAGLVLLASPALAGESAHQGGTLGIECEVPRRTPAGKLIIDDGSWRALCEADRAVALHYARLVESTRDRLIIALDRLPAPLRDDLVAHLGTNDTLDGWSYENAPILNGLRTVNPRLHSIAERWKGGILSAEVWETGRPVGDDWHPKLRARACGAGEDGRVARGAAVLVWLDPGDVRERWTPAMVQRTVRASLERRSDPFVAVDHIPGIVTAPTSDTRVLTGPDGRVRRLDACFAGVPEEALAMRLSLRDPMKTGTRTMADCAPGRVGVRRYAWAHRNGVFVIPYEAVTETGADHADRGKPLLGQSPSLPLVSWSASRPPTASEMTEDAEKDDPEYEEAWHLVRDTCRVPRTRDMVRTGDCAGSLNGQPVAGSVVRRYRFREAQDDIDPFRIYWKPVDPNPGSTPEWTWSNGPQTPWRETVLFCDGDPPVIPGPGISEPVEETRPVPDCRTAHAGRFSEGQRTGFIQTIDYPEDWPVADVEIRTIADDCFRPVENKGKVFRTGDACPVGYVGRVVEERKLRWWTRDWRVPEGRPADRTAAQAAAAYDADPAQSGLAWYDKVTLVKDWSASRGPSCRRPSSDGGERSYDVDGDGRGDYRTYAEARDAGHPTIREVSGDCGTCRGPGSRGERREPSDISDDRESRGGGDRSGFGSFLDDIGLGGLCSGRHCFAATTPVTLAGGRLVTMGDVAPGDILAQGGTVRRVIHGSALELWALNGVRVTGEHWVLFGGTWIAVSEHPEARRMAGEAVVRVVNLETSTGEIGCGAEIFADVATQTRATGRKAS